MITNFPNGVSSFGFPLLGSGGMMSIEALRLATPDIYFVSVGGSDGNDGQSPESPLRNIQTAVAKCTSNKGSYVIVGEGRYFEQVAIPQRALHLIGMGPYRTQIQAPSSPVAGDRCTPIVSVAAVAGSAGTSYISTQGVEIAGFRIGGNGGYTGIYVGDGPIPGYSATNANSSATWIHDNLIDGSNGEGTFGVVVAGGSFITVERNMFNAWATCAVVITSGATRTSYANVIRNNHILDNKAVGIAFQDTTNACVASGNYICDSTSGAMTKAIRVAATAPFGICSGAYNVAAGNYMCTSVASPIVLGASDIASGNFRYSAGSAPTYITET